MTGLEISELQDEADPRLEGVELLKRRLFLGRQRKVLLTILLRESGPAVHGFDFFIAQNPQTFLVGFHRGKMGKEASESLASSLSD